ncbi:MAG: hypothetical protein N2653_06650 [Burkholderiales bacterium]|nr:hypothetical protein [Burkholderiales bacterium]
MADKVRHCAHCGGVLEPATLERVSAGEPPMVLTLLGLPLLRCAKGHAVPVHRDFMVWLMRTLRERAGTEVPGAEAKGMLFKKYYCACGAQLPGQAGREGTFTLELAFEGAPPFRAEILTPLYKCAACGKEQARSAAELAGRVPEAVKNINDAAGFPHSG